MWLLSACWRIQYCDLFHVKLCPNIYCPYCRQAVWHLNHPPLTSLIWFPFLPYPLSQQHLLAMVHSLLQYPVDLQRSVSFVTTDLLFAYIIFLLFFNKASLTFYVRFAWKAKYGFGKSHSLMPFHLSAILPQVLDVAAKLHYEQTYCETMTYTLGRSWVGDFNLAFLFQSLFCTSRNTFTSC